MRGAVFAFAGTLLAIAFATAASAQDMKTTELERQADVDKLIDSFIALCINGEARFPASSIQEIKFSRFPKVLQYWYDETYTGRYYKVNKPYEAFLVTDELPNPKYDRYKKLCAIVVRDISASYAFKRIARVVGFEFAPAALDESAGEYGYNDPTFTYRLTVNKLKARATSMIVMQTSFLNDAEKAKAIKRDERAMEKKARQSRSGEKK